MDSVWTDKHLYSLYEKRQPPLYYFLSAPVMKVLAARFLPLGEQIAYAPVRSDFQRQGNLFLHLRKTVWSLPSADGRGHLLRLFSVFLGGISVYLIYRLARDNFPSYPSLAPAAAGFAACLPQFNFISGAIGNDSLACLLGSATIYYLLRLGKTKDKPRPRDFLLLGFLLVASLATKFNLIFLLPVSLIIVFLKARDSRSRRIALTGLLLTYLPLALLGLAALVLYPRVVPTSLRVLSGRLLRATPALLTLPRLRLMVLELYQSFWAVFGWMRLTVGGGLYDVWGMLCLSSLAGWFKFIKTGAGGSRDEKRSLILLAASFVFLFLSVIKNNLLVPQSQGRFLFPALSAISILISFGILNLFPPRLRGRAAGGMIILLLGLNLAAFFGYLLPASYTAGLCSVKTLR